MDYRLARQSNGWLYTILRPIIHVVYRLLFRKIYLHNRSGVKPNAPVLIAANHPTAFIDPIFFAIFFDPPVYNMTRGDIFEKPFFRKLMESCNMFPVFRLRDGYQGRDRNDEVFEFCQQKMLEGVAVNIFVEGEHHMDKRVLPLQKGIARIAFSTFERHHLEDLQIVPVGCNYFYPDRTRDEASIIVGTPLFVRDYWERYQQNPNVGINHLCRDILKSLKQICYNLEDSADDPLAEMLLELWKNDRPARHLPIVEHQATRFWSEKARLDQLNELPKDQKNQLLEDCTQYFTALEKEGLKDEALVSPQNGSYGWLLFLIGMAPLALLGFIAGWPLRRLIYGVTAKVVKKREFYTSVLMGLGVLTGLLYFGILFCTGIVINAPWLVTFALLLPVLAWVSIFWKETWIRWKSARKARQHPQRAQLLAQRSRIWN